LNIFIPYSTMILWMCARVSCDICNVDFMLISSWHSILLTQAAVKANLPCYWIGAFHDWQATVHQRYLYVAQTVIQGYVIIPPMLSPTNLRLHTQISFHCRRRYAHPAFYQESQSDPGWSAFDQLYQSHSHMSQSPSSFHLGNAPELRGNTKHLGIDLVTR